MYDYRLKMEDHKYIANRLEPQIAWYSKKSSRNKSFYYSFKLLEIVFAISIPFCAGYLEEYHQLKIIIGSIGVIIAILSAVNILFKFHEKWINYRSTAEALKQEKYLYQGRAGIYAGEKPLALLVERSEYLISQENSNWNQVISRKEKEA